MHGLVVHTLAVAPEEAKIWQVRERGERIRTEPAAVAEETRALAARA
jgi:hypothetical protein